MMFDVGFVKAQPALFAKTESTHRWETKLESPASPFRAALRPRQVRQPDGLAGAVRSQMQSTAAGRF